MKLRNYIALLILTFAIISVSAQTETSAPTFQLHVEGHITNIEDTPMPGVAVQVMSGSKVVASVSTDGTGKYMFDLPLNADYIINVSKDKYTTKKYSVSTRGVT